MDRIETSWSFFQREYVIRWEFEEIKADRKERTSVQSEGSKCFCSLKNDFIKPVGPEDEDSVLTRTAGSAEECFDPCPFVASFSGLVMPVLPLLLPPLLLPPLGLVLLLELLPFFPVEL